MSTSSYPSAQPFAAFDLQGRALRFVRGREGDPRWSRPGLLIVSALAAVLVLWSLTISGYANAYYAGGALAATQSWHALFFNAADLSGFTSLDKGPLSDWMMGIFGRVLGFGSFSMLLPEALCGVGAVVLLHNVVRRTLGHRAALLAALMLAVSPVSVVMARYNNPDALLALLLVASAWALVRAIESGRLRDLLLCGLFVGLAFNTKMLEAYVIVPGLAVAYLLAAPGGLWRRLGRLLAAGGVMIIVSFAWFATMMLIPAADRPFVGSTTNNSWFSLIFGYNGLSRLTGGGSGGGSGGFGGFGSSTGPLRLFTGAGVGGQIGWLLPLALVGLLAGVWVTRRAGRQDRRRAALIMFGLWALAGFVVFSFSQGTFHPYYTSAMAPAVAALAAGGAVILFDRVRAGWGWAGLLALAVGVSAIVSFLLLNDTPSFVPWLRWAILVAAAVVILAVAVAALRMGDRLPRGALVGVAIGGSALALLGGPTAYSLATIGHGQTGSNPTAGPSSADSAGFGRFGGSASARFADATRSLGPRSLGPRSLGPPSLGAGAGAARFSRAGRGGAGTNTANPALVRYLEAHRDGAKYLVAASGSQTAAPIELATHDDVITLGGFNGSDPAPTVAQVRTLVADGELRWILVGGGFGDFGGFTGGDGRSSSSEAATGTSGIGALFGAGTTRATTGGGFAARGGSSETAALTQWVEAHCQSVTVPGESSASSTGSGGAGASRGGELYACTREDAAGAAK